jgi:Holliday junction resolvase RusA-like endonuclease
VNSVSAVVYGQPQPGGSKIPGRAKSGRLFTRDDNPKLKDWQRQVAQEVGRVVDGQPVLEGPLRLTLRFYLLRPKGHYGTGRNEGHVRPSAPAHPATRPDTTKLVRAVEDALTGIVWRDDAQVCEQAARKLYGEPARVELQVEPLGPLASSGSPT